MILQATGLDASLFMSNIHIANDAVCFKNILYTFSDVFLYVYLQSAVYCHYATKFFGYSMH
jgi:hypothetical protein